MGEVTERARPSTKVLMGLGLGAVGVLALVLSPLGVLALALALCLVGAGELYRLARVRGVKPIPLVGFASVIAMFVAAYRSPQSFIAWLPSIVAATAGLGFVVALARRSLAGATMGIAVTIAGAVYAGGLGSFVVVMRRGPWGFRTVLAFGLMVALNDAVSFFGGMALGRRIVNRAFAPTVSPAKTWEGWIAGALATFAIAGIAAWQLNPPFTTGRAVVLAALVCVVAPLGDLAESTIKRDFGLKDAAHHLPGQGGVLDRIDSVLFAAPAFYFALRALAG